MMYINSKTCSLTGVGVGGANADLEIPKYLTVILVCGQPSLAWKRVSDGVVKVIHNHLGNRKLFIFKDMQTIYVLSRATKIIICCYIYHVIGLIGQHIEDIC